MKTCVYNSRKCVICGRAIPPEGRSAVRECVKPGLGDLVKSGLSAVGITEERVSKLLGRPCGCGARAEALNRLGAKLGIGGKDT